MDRSHRKQRSLAFGENVIANIAANLAVAGLVYIGGVALGLFPKTREVVVVAMTVVILASFVVFAVMTRLTKGEWRSLWISVTVITFGVFWTLAGVVDPGDPPRWMLLSFGPAFALLGVSWFRTSRRRLRDEQRDAQKIKGMSWIDSQ